jgi:hypothetical protein
LALLATVLVLALGCRKQNPVISSLEQPDMKTAFDVAQAMEMLYGNYDVKEHTSAARLPEYKGTSHSNTEEQMTVRPVLSVFVGDAGAQSFVLVTSAVPPNYDCHACAPTLGMAIFSHEGRKWTMTASNRAATYVGDWGEPPADIQLVQIGPNHPAVQIGEVSNGQGEGTAILELLIPWNGTVNRGLRRVISNAYVCGEGDEGLPCYANQRTVKFIANGKPEYYDLELELTGTDLAGGNGTPMRAQEVHGIETLKLENGKYVQVSRQGDLTTADRAVAEREGLR